MNHETLAQAITRRAAARAPLRIELARRGITLKAIARRKKVDPSLLSHWFRGLTDQPKIGRWITAAIGAHDNKRKNVDAA